MKIRSITCFFMPRLWVASLIVVSLTGYAQTANTQRETHTSEDVDPSAPITALNHLHSLTTSTPLTVNLPKIHHFTTNNGTPVSLVQARNIPMVDIGIYFNAGSARDEAIKSGAYGLASLTASMLEQGTRQHTQDALAEAVEQLGVSLAANAYRDMFTVNLRTLSDPQHLSPAVGLLTEVISEPVFRPDTLARTKAQYLIALQQDQENPDSIAAIAFDKALYGNHPYAHPTNGTLNSIPTIQPKDLQDFANTFLVASNANIAITGDISLEDAQQIANQITQALPVGTPAPALPDAKPLRQAKRIHIPFDSTQTTVMIGQLGTKRSRDTRGLQQQTNFAIADDIIGGSNFQARLMADIRKKRGLTYGIYSSMTPMLSQGSYSINFSTRNDKAQEAIDATLNVIKDATQSGVTEQELTLTKDSLINSFPLSFASNAAINNTLGMMGFYQLPDSYLTDYVKRVKTADLAQVNQSFNRLIQPNQLIIVTVGHQEKSSK